jgi:chemotaxis protein histidine kinase CheA
LQRCLVLSSVAPLQKQPAAAAGAVCAESSSSQQQCSWIEVPPGLYSISCDELHAHLTSSNSTSSDCSKTNHSKTSHGTADNSTTGTPEQQQQQQQGEAQANGASSSQAAAAAAAGDAESDAPANCGIATPADLCAAFPGLQHHPWTNDLLLQLQQYVRAPHLVPSAAAAAAEDLVVNNLQHKEQQQELQQPANQEQASQMVLQLLQDAVNTRCWTINSLHAQQGSHNPQQLQQQQQEVPLLGQQLQQMHLLSPQQQQQQRVTAQQQQVGADAAPPPDLQSLLSPSPVLILFSGGVDSTLIAALAHRALPPDVPIDLSNVCFVGGASPDRLAAHSALLELAAMAPQRQWRLIEVNSSLEEVRFVDWSRVDLNIGAVHHTSSRLAVVSVTFWSSNAGGPTRIAHQGAAAPRRNCDGPQHRSSTPQAL